MFKGQQSISFITTLPRKDVLREIENALSVLGNSIIESSGKISISGNQFSGFAHDSTIEGYVSHREDTLNVSLNYESKPNVVGWVAIIFGFLFFFVGIAVLYFPFSAKSQMADKAKSALQEIRFRLEEV